MNLLIRIPTWFSKESIDDEDAGRTIVSIKDDGSTIFPPAAR
ncbi:MAG TPA: hypothetical protein VIT00_13535 [Terrimicrobiaceae bacterium]